MMKRVPIFIVKAGDCPIVGELAGIALEGAHMYCTTAFPVRCGAHMAKSAVLVGEHMAEDEAVASIDVKGNEYKA